MGISLRYAEIVQQVKHMTVDFGGIAEILEDRNVYQWAYILHDKDEGTEPHYHIAMSFGTGRKSDQIAKWFGVSEQYVGKCKGKWADLLSYLTHKNAPNKYQYSDSEVISNFDFNKEIEENKSYNRKEDILNNIANGNIREFNIQDELTVVEFDKYKKAIENGFAYRQKILLKENKREMECVFITGTAGSGKTTQAKRMCEKKGYSYFVSSSSNDPFDGYQGQDAIILDDLRGSTFTFADLLKITDNHTSSLVKSRYKNKVLECKMLIITSIMPITLFYQNVFESSEEPILQFERRMQTYVVMSEEEMTIHYFDKLEQRYIKYKTVPNPVAKMFNSSEFENSRLNVIADLFGDDI